MSHAISPCGLATVAGTLLFCLFSSATEAEQDPIVKSLQAINVNHDEVLDAGEVDAGLRRQLGLRPGTSTRALARQRALWREVFGPGPTYKITDLAVHPYYNEKLFGVGEAEPQKVDTVSLWVPVDDDAFKIRRTFADLMESNAAAAKGAEISYSNDFNAHSEQWAFHGIVGYVWHQKKNVHFGETPEGERLDLDVNRDRGVFERWIIPSVQWDKVDTSKSDKNEQDSLILRLTSGLKMAAKDPNSIFDGARFDLSASYSTDSNLNKGIVAGEFDFKPFKHLWPGLGVGVNGAFHRVGIFRLRPELVFHAEGGTVVEDAGMPDLINQEDFLRIGARVGLAIRFEQVTGRFRSLRGLLLHTGLQYYADVTDAGPDVELFTASADWALDEDGHYSLTAVYRNGRAPLVLERENRVTVGLGVKY
jgi:hypothetical protein